MVCEQLLPTSVQGGASWTSDSGRLALSTGDRARLLVYEKAFKDIFPPIQGREMPVLDLSQNYSARPHFSSSMPSLLCGSSIWSMMHGRALLSEEAFLVMGWPVPGMDLGLTEVETDSFPFELDVLGKKGSVKKMTGNAMQCRLVGLFLAFTLSALMIQAK